MDQAIVKKAIEIIEGYENGTSDTTARIVHRINPVVEESELFDYHIAICDEIEKRGKVVLDYSAHDGLIEGLPYNLDFIVHRKDAD